MLKRNQLKIKFRNSILVFIVVLSCSMCKQTDEPIIQNPVFKTLMRTTGDTADVTTITSFGTCLMGGSTDVDEAFKWMIEKSGGGDFVVLRADVSYGYNPYIRKLGTVNSVETIIIRSDSDAINPLVAKKIRNAEALFIAGGDQADYVRLWKDTPVEDAINYLINDKKVPVGGTSAGCAIMGSSYFSAMNGSVTSSEAMNNPYNSLITLGHNNFINNPYLQNTITDQHYSQRGREGRLVTFMARMFVDLDTNPKAIAVDEETAVCIDENGIVTTLGVNNAFFLRCNSLPENCTTGTKLTWYNNKQAVRVFSLSGTQTNNTFDLTNFNSGSDENMLYYYIENGIFYKN